MFRLDQNAFTLPAVGRRCGPFFLPARHGKSWWLILPPASLGGQKMEIN
jgi:hypothetical protein